VIPGQAHSTVVFDIDSLQALRFSRPRDMVSVRRFTQRFGYELSRIEELSHVSPGMARDNPFSLRLQQFMRHALDVVALRMVTERDLDAAIEWFKSAGLAEHGGRTPEQIVAEGDHRLLMKGGSPRHN
jgi:hypothetical protein